MIATWCFNSISLLITYTLRSPASFGSVPLLISFPFCFFLSCVSITADWFSKQGEVASQFSHFGVSFLHSAEHGMLGVYQGMQLQLGTGYGWLSGLGGI